ncbi:MAG: hypothetical protein HN846_02695 [Candidatus Pacebacteria bacterium]|jgi:hypothetical protein|nr:hypothetical protein [Candidatus Paceibacterota bacterium]MBT3511770.1 hypothetical protein [Candidatus Paceibacterota bacterium]MBT4005195.1 hypothetical protein [Candidatus Paceibacterota bacterium]MBT4359021.1 hypothetical protein [Candidatus Paceibacterota bacterium]MBT4681296.1 hypothetical protein [Candidatus Paceibacterota bacterium]
MKKFLLSLALFLIAGFFVIQPSQAQTPSLLTEDLEVGIESTDSAEATAEATLASPSAETVQKIQEKKDLDITETEGEQKSKLVRYLEENPLTSKNFTNLLQQAIRNAVKEGVPPNVIVLVLLFPLVSSFIAASRHIIGLRGFGIYIPAVLSIALVSTGIIEGIAMFLVIVFVALPAKKILTRFKLPYLPRTAILLWFVSLAILGILLLAPLINMVTLMTVNIFSIMILVLLAENFLDAQGKTKPMDAIALTVETLSLALLSSFILQWEALQKFALLQPELLTMITLGINFIVGKFSGLRFAEYFRFRSLMEE